MEDDFSDMEDDFSDMEDDLSILVIWKMIYNYFSDVEDDLKIKNSEAATEDSIKVCYL